MKKPYRPILNIPKTTMEKIFDIIGIGLFLFFIINFLSRLSLAIHTRTNSGAF